MQLNSRFWPVLSLVVFTTFIACKKDSQEPQQQNQNPELTTHTDDQARVSNEMDAVSLDLNVALEKTTSFSGRIMGDSLCSATLSYDTLNATKKITITYNGADCWGGNTRTGSVLISMPSGVHWKDVGATLTITYQNLKVTRKSDNKSITINGSHSLVNVSGGLMKDLFTHDIIHTISSSNMSITFDDGSQRTWQVARKRVYSITNGGTITITGNHTDGAVNGIAEWGTDRFGNAFTTIITQALKISASCDFRLISGQIQHSRLNSSASVTFGLDKDGNAVSCPSGNFYYKLTWTGPNSNTLTYIAPY